MRICVHTCMRITRTCTYVYVCMSVAQFRAICPCAPSAPPSTATVRPLPRGYRSQMDLACLRKAMASCSTTHRTCPQGLTSQVAGLRVEKICPVLSCPVLSCLVPSCLVPFRPVPWEVTTLKSYAVPRLKVAEIPAKAGF